MSIDTGPTVAELDAEMRNMSDGLLKYYSEKLDYSKLGSGRSWESIPVEQRKALRAANELARRGHEKERAEAKAAEAAKAEAAHNARIEAEIDAYKSQIRGAFRGTAEQFEAAWPRILQDWQVEQARAATTANYERIKARVVTEF